MIAAAVSVGLLVIVLSVWPTVRSVRDTLAFLFDRDVLDEVGEEWEPYETLRALVPHPDRTNVWVRR